MAEEDFFRATGPNVDAGFETHGTSIRQGVAAAGTEVGVVGLGPLGVRGIGRPGPGGEFVSLNLNAQIHVDPHLISDPGDRVPVDEILEFKPPETMLPLIGRLGDIWLTTLDDPPGCILWVCVRENTNTGGPGAKWAQVLLGKALRGKAVPFDE